MLIAFDEEKRNTLWRDYTATALGMIGKMLGQDSWTLPFYVEMAYPDIGLVDTRTSQEIIDDIKRKLTT